MRFLVIGHVLHKISEGQYFAYGPYVKEMNRWFSYVDEVTVLSPLDKNRKPDPIDLAYTHPNLSLIPIEQVNLLSVGSIFKTVFLLPALLLKIGKAMRKADHIQLRCPGNIGLLGAIAQIAFPKKIKSAKYAGNWDRRAAKPFTYKLQQLILSNTSLSKKMTVLVYGNWPNESKNIKPFFTASYSESEKESIKPREFHPQIPIQLVFIGGLVSGKNPLQTAEVALKLKNDGVNFRLTYFGEGSERRKLEEFIHSNGLENEISLKGNVNSESVKKALQEAHFLIFLSSSEGWPKVVAEAMFWGCVPITTPVSCVPQMLGEGKRGVLIQSNPVQEAVEGIRQLILDPARYKEISFAAAEWSRQFTLEKFEEEIGKILKVE